MVLLSTWRLVVSGEVRGHDMPRDPECFWGSPEIRYLAAKPLSYEDSPKVTKRFRKA